MSTTAALLKKFLPDSENPSLENAVTFGSCMGPETAIFSNFCLLENPIELDGLKYPTAEHAFQAWYKLSREERTILSVDGELGNEGGFSLFYNNAEAEKKRKFWGPTKTGRPAMLGILAKLAANRPHKIGLLTHERTNVHDEQSFKKLMKLFYVILKRKYSKNPVLLRKLVATGDRYLLEFSRSARREANNGRPPLWSGLIQDGRLYGHNFMGRLHMALRDEIKKTISKRAA